MSKSAALSLANPADLFKTRATFFRGVPAMQFLREADRP
jgi:hypothetical protein